MKEKEWFVINIRVPEKASEKEDFLIRIHSEVVSKFKAELISWHFLWEGSPFRHTLLMRFFGNADLVEEIRKNLTKLLDNEGVDWKPDETYDGEAKHFGSRGWGYIMRILCLGSDFAIDIIENERKGVKNEEYKLSLSGYLERWVHLFMNQLGTRVREDATLFQLSAHRTAVNSLGEVNYRKICGELDKQIPKFLDDFHKKILLPYIDSLIKKTE
jgi:hypothetical protein